MGECGMTWGATTLDFVEYLEDVGVDIWDVTRALTYRLAMYGGTQVN